ncbi:uncharacterized protein L969DRAFT_102886 [Mixia osmundae IAM 14324]|uniref:Protoheme IX farnesyltransferase, mitochondrial n=1 Tax=Mixia osmundae (strain CBS 9802 / IAM 14324 / JCM 22182 / KY 12970) TaxID=764103 RepID=G7E8R7_MIXOS|nr:uncharacterized protein L969DRAFT_102886 [Mixia osmundae IAM 14324]KEI40171.1 hypothetical protein L969DRAFT_102886 [Mixia osmundae IAM 14324]GAA99535.1 hypothetical protein E5Q_06236 [Mixia osmundae IAM 14324]
MSLECAACARLASRATRSITRSVSSIAQGSSRLTPFSSQLPRFASTAPEQRPWLDVHKLRRDALAQPRPRRIDRSRFTTIAPVVPANLHGKSTSTEDVRLVAADRVSEDTSTSDAEARDSLSVFQGIKLPESSLGPTTAIVYRPIRSHSLPELIQLYKGLTKAKLSALITLTTMAGYAMCPLDPGATHAAMETFLTDTLAHLPIDMDQLALAATASSGGSQLSLPILLTASVGTALCCASANTFNQLVEVPYDAQMARTRNRVLVRRQVTPLHAFTFASSTALAGVGMLYHFVNPLTASIGLANIILYSFIYTPLKRVTIFNTWIGAVVGALPPLMGWAACTNTLDLLTQPGAWLLALLVFAWQFPHFNSLAWNLRADYAKAGYRMMSVTNPALNARVALRYSIACVPICLGLPYLGLTSAVFGYMSFLPNGLLIWTSYRFWRRVNDQTARELFWASLVHLPALLILMMLCKQGSSAQTEESSSVSRKDAETPSVEALE